MEAPAHQQNGQGTINNGLITITNDQPSGLTIQDKNNLNFTNTGHKNKNNETGEKFPDDMDMSISGSNQQIFMDGGSISYPPQQPKKRSLGAETRSQITNHTTNKTQSITDQIKSKKMQVSREAKRHSNLTQPTGGMDQYLHRKSLELAQQVLLLQKENSDLKGKLTKGQVMHTNYYKQNA